MHFSGLVKPFRCLKNMMLYCKTTNWTKLKIQQRKYHQRLWPDYGTAVQKPISSSAALQILHCSALQSEWRRLTSHAPSCPFEEHDVKLQNHRLNKRKLDTNIAQMKATTKLDYDTTTAECRVQKPILSTAALQRLISHASGCKSLVAEQDVPLQNHWLNQRKHK